MLQNNKKLLIVFLLLLAVFSMILALVIKNSVNKPDVVSENTPSTSRFKNLDDTTVTPTPTVFTHNYTTLSFNPALQSVKVGQNATLNLLIDTGTNKIAGADFTLSFDPKIIEIASVAPAGFFENPDILINKTDNTLGTLRYALGSTNPRSGNGNFITVVITGKTPGMADISFTSKTKVASIDEGVNNVLKTAEGAKITVN